MSDILYILGCGIAIFICCVLDVIVQMLPVIIVVGVILWFIKSIKK
jgi:hypothetical protein